MLSIIKKNFVLFFLLGLTVVTFAHPHTVEESDAGDLHTQDANVLSHEHAHDHFEGVILRSPDETDIDAAINKVLARSDGDLYKREIVKRDLGSDIRSCIASHTRCIGRANRIRSSRDRQDALYDCDHTYASCITNVLTHYARAISRTKASGKDCGICLEPIHGGDRCTTLPCGHFEFHTACLGPWLQEANTCPFCRKKVY